jgi:hypothetical protein
LGLKDAVSVYVSADSNDDGLAIKYGKLSWSSLANVIRFKNSITVARLGLNTLGLLFCCFNIKAAQLTVQSCDKVAYEDCMFHQES